MVMHVLWGYFKYWLLPASIFAGCAGWDAHSLGEYVAAVHRLLPNFVGHGALSSFFAGPPGFLAYLLIPKGLVYPIFCVAAIAGNVGFFVMLWLMCSWISPPSFLLEDGGEMHD